MIPVNILAVRYLASAGDALCRGLGAPEGMPCLALITTDCDDATYIALDEATKAADVQVCFGSSFYAGAANASTPNAGEVLGILAATTPGALHSGMDAALSALGNCQILSGSYIGTGTAGADGPCRLEFGFKPLVLFMNTSKDYTDNGHAVWIHPLESRSHVSNNNVDFEITWEETAVSWYVSATSTYVNAANQYNEEGEKYTFLALGYIP